MKVKTILFQTTVLILTSCLGFSLMKLYLDFAVVKDDGTQSAIIDNKEIGTNNNQIRNNTDSDEEDKINDQAHYLQDERVINLLSKLNSPSSTSETNNEPQSISFQKTPLLDKPDNRSFSYSELLSSVSDLESAFRKLRPVETETEMVRLLSIIDSITAGWSTVDSPHVAEHRIIVNLLNEHWRKSPDLISASDCIYCGSHFYIIAALVSASGTDIKWRSKALEIHPRYMQLLDSHDMLFDEVRIEYAKLYSRFILAGDAQIAEYIAHILLKNEDYPEFAFWAKRGLNGSNSVRAIKDFSAVPRDYLIDAWESAARGGYVNTDLTIYLLRTGHRPALRYVLWLLDGSATYLQTHHYRYNEKKYIKALNKHTLYNYSEDKNFDEHYSKNWRQIYWDDDSSMWQLY